MEIKDLKAMAKILVEEMNAYASADFAFKWESGSVVVFPNDNTLKEHEIPIDKLMHKIIMIRDNLRVLEQQINSNDSLSKGEKLKFQSYITRSYGSLTSFNFLFRNEEDKFTSKK